MADIDADIWVCGECRSINNLRAKQCYRCRTPRDVAAVDPSQIEGTGHGKLREVALPEFRSTRWAALLASALLILVAVMQVVSTVSDAILFGRVLRDPGLLNDPAFYQSVESMVAGTVALATLGVAVVALIAWSFWLSRAAMAMPALGLGYPAANGLMAFLENFLPGLNLFRVPAIVRDVMRRLDSESLRGEALIFAAWIGLLGGYLVPRVGAYLGLLGSGTLEEIVRETLLVQAIATALVVVGATFLVALIWWIERRIARRRAAQLEEGSPAASSASETSAVDASPVATYRVEEDPEFVAGPEVATDAPEPKVAADAPESVTPTASDRIAGPLGSVTAMTVSEAMLNRPITAVTGQASMPAAPTSGPGSPAPETPQSAALAPDGQPDGERFGDARPTSYEPPLEPSPGAEPELSLAAPESSIEPSPAVEPELSLAAPESSIEPSPAVVPDESLASPGSIEPTSAEAEADQTVPEAPGEAATGPQLHLRVESVSSMIATMDGESEPITLDELRVAAEALARANGSAVIATVGTSFGALSLAEQAFEVLTDARVATTVEE